MKSLIDVIVGSTFLICGTIIFDSFWLIGALIQILGILILLNIISFYDIRNKICSNMEKYENK